MAVFGGPNNFGLFKNGDFRKGNNSSFVLGGNEGQSVYRSSGGPDGGAFIEFTGGEGVARFSGVNSTQRDSSIRSDFIEVDTSATYQMIAYAKTITKGSAQADNSDEGEGLAGGFMGFSCYDSSYRFIDNRNTGGKGNTTLSRALNAGDTHFYLTDGFTQSTFSGDGWLTGADLSYDGSSETQAFYRHVVLFPASHPEYSAAHKYSRIGLGDFNLRYKSLTQTDQGDWEGKFSNSDDTDAVFPDIGYATPAGTPVSRGVASGTYNYALGTYDYPLGEWTRYATAPFTGESSYVNTPFRFGTKYVRFLILKNYRRRNVATQDHVYGIGNIFFGKVLDGKDYRNNLLP